MKRLSSSIALLGAFLALSITACDNDTGPEPGVESISVTPSEVTMNVGDVVNFSANVEVTGDASKDVNWSTSNSSVVTISGDGVATGQSEGTATVTATSVADNSKKASASVKVEAPDPAQISIKEYRAVSTQESDNDGPVPSPDTVGTHCCADNAGLDDLITLITEDFSFFGANGTFTILEMDVEVDAAGRDVRRVEMLINGEVVDFQEITSTGGSQAAGSNVLTYTLSKNTLDFSGGAKQGGVVEPDVPNDNDAQISARVKFANGQTKTVTLDNKIAIKNHQQVIVFDKELPPTKLNDEDERWWGGPDSEASFGITVVDHMDVGASQIEVANICERKGSGGILGPGFDQGNGHGNTVETTVDNGFMWSLTSQANGWDFDDEGNKGVSGFYCPVPVRFLDAAGEEWSGHEQIDMGRIMLDIAFTQELAHPHPKIPEGLSAFGFLALDWRPPVCGVENSETGDFPFEIHVAQSAPPAKFYTDADYGFDPDLLVSDFNRWFHTGTFFAGTDDGTPLGIGTKDRRFDVFRPFDSGADDGGLSAAAERWEDVTGPVDGQVPERMRDLGVALISTIDMLNNENPDPMCGPTGPFGTDHTMPEFRDIDPDPAQMDMIVLRWDVPAGEDAEDFMPMFEVFDPKLGDRTAELGDKPGSGVNHGDDDRPRVRLTTEDLTDGGFEEGGSDGITTDDADLDSDANGDGTKGDYIVDWTSIAGVEEGNRYQFAVFAPDLAIHPNIGMFMFPIIKADSTDPSVTRIDPPQSTTESSDQKLIFTIEGEVTDQFGLSSVRVEVRDADSNGDDACQITDTLVPSGDGPGEVLPDNVIEVTPLGADDRFSQEVTVHNADPDGVSDVDQHLCFYIVADDDARNYEGELFPHSNNAFTHTDIDWQ